MISRLKRATQRNARAGENIKLRGSRYNFEPVIGVYRVQVLSARPVDDNEQLPCSIADSGSSGNMFLFLPSHLEQ